MSATASPASEPTPPIGIGPARFRRRLTLAFVYVAAATGAVLVVSTLVVIRHHRYHVFVQRAKEEAQLSILLTPPGGSVESLGTLLRLSRGRHGVGTVVVSPEATVSSSTAFGIGNVPPALFDRAGDGSIHHSAATVGGRHYLVFAGSPRDGVKVFFFFPLQGLDRGILDFAVVLAGAWLLAVLASAAFGSRVARRTLRPVREAALASQSLAEGLLETRLESTSNDEFGQWANSFNRMADALATKIEAISRAEARERQFTANVAHELRTPISAMVSAAEILGQELDRLPSDVRRPAALLVSDVKRLSDLVLELLELARLDAGVEPLHFERLTVDEALAAATSTWPGDGSITIETEPGITVLADRARFRRVMVNLVRNALTHGGTDVTIQACRRNGAVTIEVRDRGPGLPEGSAQRIFDRFYKGDSSRSGGGSGLGLAIALEHARAQGGSLTADNAPEGGARFTFTLPAAS